MSNLLSNNRMYTCYAPDIRSDGFRLFPCTAAHVQNVVVGSEYQLADVPLCHLSLYVPAVPVVVIACREIHRLQIELTSLEPSRHRSTLSRLLFALLAIMFTFPIK